MDKDITAFLSTLTKWYDHGLLKEVYRSEKAIVVNAFNQMYFAFPLYVMAEFTENFPGFSLNARGLKAIIKDDQYVNEHFTLLSSESQEDSLVVLTEDFFNHMLKNKEKFSQRPATQDVDLAFEQELMEKGADAIRQELLTPKRGFWNFFKRT